MRTTTRDADRRLDRWITLVTVVLAALAMRREVRKPRRDRTWHGALFGWLPYDFRRPTMQRVRDTFWAPGDSRVFVPRFFGLGWDVNLGRLVALLRGNHHGVNNSRG